MEYLSKPEPIEEFHSEALKEFHKGAKYSCNETFVDGIRYVNGIALNDILANFKNKIIKEYNIGEEE